MNIKIPPTQVFIGTGFPRKDISDTDLKSLHKDLSENNVQLFEE